MVKITNNLTNSIVLLIKHPKYVCNKNFKKNKNENTNHNSICNIDILASILFIIINNVSSI